MLARALWGGVKLTFFQAEPEAGDLRKMKRVIKKREQTKPHFFFLSIVHS